MKNQPNPIIKRYSERVKKRRLLWKQLVNKILVATYDYISQLDNYEIRRIKNAGQKRQTKK